MEFMIGMYADGWSGETEIIKIRGSGRVAASSERPLVVVDAGTLVVRLISAELLQRLVLLFP